MANFYVLLQVVCYFSNWAGLRSGDGQYLPEHLDARLCSHVVYAFAKLDEESLVLRPSGPKSDLEAGYYQRVVDRARQQGARVLLSVGGWADSAGDKYSRLVKDPAARKKFVASSVAFLKQHGFQVCFYMSPSIFIFLLRVLCWNGTSPSAGKATAPRALPQISQDWPLWPRTFNPPSLLLA